MPLPSPNKGESKEEFVSRFMSDEMAKKDFPEEKQRLAVAYQKYKDYSKKKESSVRFCMKGIEKKESIDDAYTYEAYLATTHPDRENDILSPKVIEQIVSLINDDACVGPVAVAGNSKGLSLFHDWIHIGDPTIEEAAFMKHAEVVDLEDGHKGAKVEFVLNKYYDSEYEGKHYDVDRIKYEIENGKIGGLSIEYDTDDNHSKMINMNGEDYRYIQELTEFAGGGLARSRIIANPHAVIMKEVVSKVKELEETKMSEEVKVEQKEETLVNKEEVLKEESTPEQEAVMIDAVSEEPVNNVAVMAEKEIGLTVKEVIDSKEFKEALSELKPESKVLKSKEEKMDTTQIHVKEMNRHLLETKDGKPNMTGFKASASAYFKENNEWIESGAKGYGIPLNPPTIQVKCMGTKMVMVSGIQTKDQLNAGSNATTAAQSSAEFSDLFVPGIVDAFNNRSDLFDALPKVDHMMGTPNFQWRINTTQKTSLSVDVDNPTITKSFMGKQKLQTPIKEYRNGISVTDFAIIHSRASIGDLFMIEAEKAAIDLRADINEDLYNENADGDSTDVLGLEAVADAAGNTTLYGLTRSTANMLAPATATDTYIDVSGALTTAYLRQAIRAVEMDGAMRGNLRIVTSPRIRDVLFELLDGQQQFLSTMPAFGFAGVPAFDGIPIIVDPDCPATASQAQLYVVDLESYFVVVSRPPQLIGLAKVSAAQEAYVVINLAVVYSRPRRICMLNNLT